MNEIDKMSRINGKQRRPARSDRLARKNTVLSALTRRSRYLLPVLMACSPWVTVDASAAGQTCGTGIQLVEAIDTHACARLVSLLDTLEQRPGEKIHIVRQRATAAAKKIRTLLVSEGYYAAKVLPVIPDGEGPAWSFTVTPGKRFKITDHTIAFAGENGDDLPRNLDDMALEGTSSPRGDDLLAIQKSILAYLQNNGRPLAELVQRRVLANFETREAKLVYEIDPGPPCIYGPVKVQGLDRIKPGFVSSSVRLPEGKACSREEMEKQRLDLAKTGLFSSVEINPVLDSKTATPDPVEINVKEAKARTVGAGLSYATNRGAGGRIYWEHRNLFGRMERLHIELTIEETQQGGTIAFRKPWPGHRAVFFAELGASTEDREAYDAAIYTLKAGVEHPLQGPWRLAGSAEYEYADVEDMGIREEGHSIMAPLVLSRSTVDDILDPREGLAITLLAAPAYATFGDGTAFVKLDARLSHHWPFTEDQKYGLSTWGHIGSLQGGKASDIPATRLYYGGGAKSVRAIAWERLGTLDTDGIPTGGRSILDGGIELRADATKAWQVVGFIEGGRVFDASTPDFEEDILWGGGLGVRYRTPIGPLRFDIAAPFDPRPGDDAYQFYIGLGQAF